MADQQNTGGVTMPSKPPPWNDPVVRSIVFQIVALILLAWFFWTIFQNTLTNMETRGISTGFAFLNREAGFGILMSLIEYDESHTYGRTFVVGLLNTILVSVLGIIIATILGFVMGVARLSDNWIVARLASIYVETLRNIPLLLQLFFWYTAVLQALPGPRSSLKLSENIYLNNRGLNIPKPIFQDGFEFVWIALLVAIAGIFVLLRWATKRLDETGHTFPVFWTSVGLFIGLPLLVFLIMGLPLNFEVARATRFSLSGGANLIPEFIALLIGLSTYTAAFIAEIVRAGILAVSHGQTEAARSLGLRHGQTLQLIVIPQAMRVIIPPLTSPYLNLTKNSSLAAAIAYPDLVSVFAGTTLNQAGQALEIIGMVMAVYLSLSLGISFLMNLYNKKMALVER